MGCDIHVMLEHRKHGTERWDALSYYAINPGRDYEKFSRLAGVRGGMMGEYIEPRGLPSDPSWQTGNEYWLFISEEPGNGEHYVKPDDANRWVAQGCSVFKNDEEGKPVWVSDPDQHSHTWLTLAEWKKAIGKPEQQGWDMDWHALTAAADYYGENDHDVRFVFWFDN
jgi:hypothetical protein